MLKQNLANQVVVLVSIGVVPIAYNVVKSDGTSVAGAGAIGVFNTGYYTITLTASEVDTVGPLAILGQNLAATTGMVQESVVREFPGTANPE